MEFGLDTLSVKQHLGRSVAPQTSICIEVCGCTSKLAPYYSTHWDRVTHICVGNLTINGSNNGLSPGWRQAIIWTIDGILLIGALGTNFSEIFGKYQSKFICFSQENTFKNIVCEMAVILSRPKCVNHVNATHLKSVGYIFQMSWGD